MTPEALARLHRAAMQRDRPWSAEEFAALLDSPHFLCALPGAFALGRAVADEAELLMLATDPARQRRGLGRRALAAYEAEAARRGARLSLLEVAEDNTPALRLYEAAGYRESGRRPGYYARPGATGAAALLMCRALG